MADRASIVTPHRGVALLPALAAVALTHAVLGQHGDDPASAVPLALNTPTSGTTFGFTNISDEICPYTGSTSPDVYYVYTPTTSHDLTVELCESGYDTKTYVYDSSLALITNVNGEQSCNDDACSSAGGGAFRSLLDCVPVAAGVTYYIVVDGHGGAVGDYSITLHDTAVFTGDPEACAEILPCIFDPCDGSYTQEGEPCNDDGLPECFNGGCHCWTEDAFSPIACGETICGQGYFNGESRDTDWFEIQTFVATTFTLDVIAEFEAVVGRHENFGDPYCYLTGFAEVDVGETSCEPLQIVSPELAPGYYRFFIAANFTETVLCGDEDPGNDYIATLSCEEVSPPCPWDFDGDLEVGFQDLLNLLANWGPCPGTGG